MWSSRVVPLFLIGVLLLPGCASSDAVDTTQPDSSESVTDAPGEVEEVDTSSSTQAPTTGERAATAQAEPEMTTTTVPVEPPPAPECAELLDGAQLVHPSEDNDVVADFDGDGVDDEIWTVVDDGESFMQVVASRSSRVSEPLEAWIAWPDFDGTLAAMDIDRDGVDEVFYSQGGNTSLTGLIIELSGCELRAITADTEGTELFAYDGGVEYRYFAGGNSCAPMGCHFQVSCSQGNVMTEVTFTSVYPEISALSPDFDESVPLDEQTVLFAQATVTVSEGHATVIDVVAERPVPFGEIAAVDGPEVDCSEVR